MGFLVSCGAGIEEKEGSPLASGGERGEGKAAMASSCSPPVVRFGLASVGSRFRVSSAATCHSVIHLAFKEDLAIPFWS